MSFVFSGRILIYYSWCRTVVSCSTRQVLGWGLFVRGAFLMRYGGRPGSPLVEVSVMSRGRRMLSTKSRRE